MIEAGEPDETIASVLLDSRYRISDNPLEKGRRARPFVAREIGKARKYQENKPEGPKFIFDDDEDQSNSSKPVTDSATATKPNELPVIRVSGREPRDVAGDAIMALRLANVPQPRVFLRAGSLVRTLRTEDGRPLIETLNKDSLFASLIDVASFERYDARSKKWHAAGPPDDVIRYISGRGAWPFPPLVGISETPIVRPDGTIVTAPGYDSVTRVVLAPATGLSIPTIQDDPTDEQVADAVKLLGELIQDFAFDGEDGKPSSSRRTRSHSSSPW